MKAVNLIPQEDRRGGLAGPGRSGGGVYVFLAGLAVLVVAMGAYVLASNSINDRKAELSRVSAEVATAEAEATRLKPFSDFARLSQTRIQTVATLAQSRFDWERALRDLSRVLPRSVWLSSMTGTVAPAVQVEGGGAQTSGLRGALAQPALQIVGCTESHREVSRAMARLRRMRGVTRVSLASSEKTEGAATGAAPGGGGSEDCRNGSDRFPRFELVVFFAPAPGAAAGSAGTSPTPVATPVTPSQPPAGGQAAPPANQPAGNTPGASG